MATWLELGSVRPDHFRWTLFDVPVVGGEIFRIRQINDDQVWRGYGLLTFFWDIGSDKGKYGTRRIYPAWKDAGQTSVFTTSIPRQLREIGVEVRYAAMMLPYWTPRAINESDQWTLHLDALAYDPISPGGSGEIPADLVERLNRMETKIDQLADDVEIDIDLQP